MGGRNDIIDGSNEIFDHSTTSGNRSEDHDNSSDLFAVEKVLKATEFLLNFTSSSASSVPTSSLLPHDGNFSISENIKLLSPFNSTSIIGGNFTDQNHSSYTPFIPDYIRSTSIIVCVIILIFGLIGNTMVGWHSGNSLHLKMFVEQISCRVVKRERRAVRSSSPNRKRDLVLGGAINFTFHEKIIFLASFFHFSLFLCTLSTPPNNRPSWLFHSIVSHSFFGFGQISENSEEKRKKWEACGSHRELK